MPAVIDLTGIRLGEQVQILTPPPGTLLRRGDTVTVAGILDGEAERRYLAVHSMWDHVHQGIHGQDLVICRSEGRSFDWYISPAHLRIPPRHRRSAEEAAGWLSTGILTIVAIVIIVIYLSAIS